MPPLQVLAVAKGNNEKFKVWDEARDDIILYKHNKTYLFIYGAVHLDTTTFVQ